MSYVLVEEVGERPVAHVVEQSREPHRLGHQALGGSRRRRLHDGQRVSQARVQMAGPQRRFVHHTQAVREPAVLGSGKYPARALQLADAPHALKPGRIDEIAFGGRLVRKTQASRTVRRETFRQFDVAVDRVADEIDRPKLRVRAICHEIDCRSRRRRRVTASGPRPPSSLTSRSVQPPCGTSRPLHRGAPRGRSPRPALPTGGSSAGSQASPERGPARARSRPPLG